MENILQPELVRQFRKQMKLYRSKHDARQQQLHSLLTPTLAFHSTRFRGNVSSIG